MLIDTNAIVLHRMKYKNSSLIARLFTQDEGKISIIVNGATNKKGNLFGVIYLLSELLLYGLLLYGLNISKSVLYLSEIRNMMIKHIFDAFL